MPQSSVTVVVATYNAKKYLELVLESIKIQSILPVEVLVADDGSSDGTKELIQNMTTTYPCELKHIWQEDNGFRKAAIINKALAKAKGDYIIHIDGDVILNKHFVQDHLFVARENFMTTGSRAQISENLKNKIFETKNVNLSPFTIGVFRKQNAIRLKCLMKHLLDSYKKDKPYFARGCNMAFWKKDFLQVNGFNEDIPHIGTEDFEFVARLNNIGVKRQYLKFGAIQYHIYHKKRAGNTHPDNLKILNDVIQNKVVRCNNGVDKYLS